MFKQIGTLFTSKDSAWINTLEDKDINVVVIQKYLSQYKKSMPVARVLDKYTYNITPKKYLALAWSLLFWNKQKLPKAPFIKYHKIENKEIDYAQKIMHMSNNDYRYVKEVFQGITEQQLEIKKI